MQELHRAKLDKLGLLVDLEELHEEVSRARVEALVAAAETFTHQEIATVLGVSRSAVSQRLERATRGGS